MCPVGVRSTTSHGRAGGSRCARDATGGRRERYPRRHERRGTRRRWSEAPRGGARPLMGRRCARRLFSTRSSDGGFSRKYESTSCARFTLFAHTSTAPRFEAFVRGRCPRRERSRTINSCAVAHWSRQSLSRLPGLGTHARGSSARSAPPVSLRERVLPCERLPMFEPCLQGRELCHSCDLCGDLPILGVRRSCDVCDDFGACRSRRSVSEQARASIAEAQISLPTNRASRRTPLDAAPRPRTRTRDPHAFSSRRVHLVSVPNVSSAQTARFLGRVSRSCVSASKTKTRKRRALLTSNTRHHHQTLSFMTHTHHQTLITHALPTQTSARIATAHPTLCALEVRRTRVRTRPTTRRRRTRRRLTTARPCTPENSAP